MKLELNFILLISIIYSLSAEATVIINADGESESSPELDDYSSSEDSRVSDYRESSDSNEYDYQMKKQHSVKHSFNKKAKGHIKKLFLGVLNQLATDRDDETNSIKRYAQVKDFGMEDFDEDDKLERELNTKIHLSKASVGKFGTLLSGVVNQILTNKMDEGHNGISQDNNLHIDMDLGRHLKELSSQILHSSKTNIDLKSMVAEIFSQFLKEMKKEDGFATDFLGNNFLGNGDDNFINSPSFSETLHSKKSQLVSNLILKELDKKLQAARKEKYKELAKHISTFKSPFQGCSNATYPHLQSREIKTYKINLDIKPQDRWKEVVEQNKDEIKVLADFFESQFGDKLMGIVDSYIAWLHKTLPHEYFLELKGLAEASGLTIGRVTLYNVFYEFFSVCTSIVMAGEDGQMYHGRNLDFGLFMGWDAKNHTWFITELLRPLIIKLEFIKNGKPLYSAVSYAGYTGILTAVKKNMFSLSIDERFIMNGGYVGIAEWILGRRDMAWLGLLTREVMEVAKSYQEAQQMLAATPLVAPVYFILAGNTSKQGCIVTRGRRDSDIWELGGRHKGQSGTWYLVETNFDHWQETPFFDQRRQYAVQCMEELGHHQPLDTLYKVLSTRPVLNKETTLTALMEISTGSLQVWKRECEDPCWPF